jgi:hypothetical protein
MLTIALWVFVVMGFTISWRNFGRIEALRQRWNPLQDTEIKRREYWLSKIGHASFLLLWYTIFCYHLGGGWIALFLLLAIFHVSQFFERDSPT